MTQPTAFQDGDWYEVRRLIEFLLARVVDTGGRQVGVRFGSSSATWTANTNSANVTVTHGLGRSPIFVGLTSHDALISYVVTARSATTATVVGFVTTGGLATITLTFDWVVIG